MESIGISQFRDNLKFLVDRVVSEHIPVKVTRQGGEAFIVVDAEEWERDQETLFVLQNSDLMRQIAQSQATHALAAGYTPTPEQVAEILEQESLRTEFRERFE